jgi:pyroglutamyl-peptidase
MMKRVLITGFDPFDGETINPSFEAILTMKSFKNIEVHKLCVPTEFYHSSKIVIDAIHQLKPDYVIMVGQAGNSKTLLIERVAINIDDAKIPDNRNVQPIDHPISVFGPNAYFSTLPIKFLKESLNLHNVPAEISNSAGTYVCNHLMYSVLHEISQRNLNIKAGFIHVPFVESQIELRPNSHFLPIDVITLGLEVMIDTLAKVSA